MTRDALRIREILRRDFVQPAPFLKALAERSSSTPDVQWRSNQLKEVRETLDACLLAHGLGLALGTEIFVLPGEVEDFDCVLRTTGDEGVQLVGVQIKEVPSDERNHQASLSSLLSDLAAGPPTDAILLIRLNRQGFIPDEALAAPHVPHREVWYLWASSQDGLRWCVYGDAKREPRLFEFDYPL